MGTLVEGAGLQMRCHRTRPSSQRTERPGQPSPTQQAPWRWPSPGPGIYNPGVQDQRCYLLLQSRSHAFCCLVIPGPQGREHDSLSSHSGDSGPGERGGPGALVGTWTNIFICCSDMWFVFGLRSCPGPGQNSQEIKQEHRWWSLNVIVRTFKDTLGISLVIPVVKNTSAYARNLGSVIWSKKFPHAAGQLRLCATITEPAL